MRCRALAVAACTTALLAALAPGAAAHADRPDDGGGNVQQNAEGSRCGALPELVTAPVGLLAPKLCE